MTTGSIHSALRPQLVRILAALDAPGAEPNERILAQAAQLTKKLGGELHVVGTYAAFGDARAYQVERYLPALRVKARDRRRCAIREILRRFHIDAAIHVEEGTLANAIDAVASRLNAAVVIGATAPSLPVAISATVPTVTTPAVRPALPTEFAA